MHCKKAKNLFFLYKELSPSENEMFLVHLKDCKPCDQEFQTYRESFSLISQTLTFQEPQNYWNEYWHKLSRHITKKSWWSRTWERMFESFSALARPIYGPVPAYAVSLAVLILVLGLYPLVSSKSQVKFESNLVVQHSKLISAEVQGSMTVYKLAQR
ncbi:MAG: hypothetical protein A2145_02615 [candidate division Zixibacteria bacterium RBG_16_40_9]|nr:MAG: hypothetical protein A2145_02615 [candidate division Zixibacteria bacterium RBG_16_40_9]